MTVPARDLLSSLVFLSCLYNVLSTSVVETTLNVAGSPASSQTTSRMEEGQITTTALSVSDSPRDPGSSSALAPGGSSVVESVVMTTADSISATGTTGTIPIPDPASTTSSLLDVSSPAVSSSTPSSSLVQPTSIVLPSMLTGSISSNDLTNVFTDSRCVCDLHVTSCDLNCCCDLDCLTEELQIFTSCKDIPPQSNNPVCVSADHYIQSQTTFRTELVTRGSSDLLCIFIDNYPGRTEFGSPPDVSSTGVNTILRLYGTPGDTLRARATYSYDVFYKFGDPLQSVYNNSILGTWMLPVAQNSAFCNRGSAVEFLEDQFSSCQINVADMDSICNTMSSINMELYTADYGVLRLPSAALNASMVVPIVVNSVVCRTEGGVDRTCGGGPLTPSVSESRCVNVLKELSVQVEHQGSGGIRSVGVNAVLADVPIGFTGSLEQKFSVKYRLFNSTVSGDRDVDLRRSGVGGYQDGLPLLAGKLVEQVETPSFINISVDPLMWFTIKNSAQYCTDAAITSVNFLQEVETTCFLLPSAYTTCGDLQEAAYNFLSPWNTSVSHIGRVGDADPSNLAEWVEVGNTRGPDTMQISSQCINIPVGVSILIMYARTGSTSLPSSQVFGVHTVYQTEAVCIGPVCGPIPKPIPIHTRMSYVDLTQKPTEVLKSITDIQGQLPEDFFYPFFVASSSCSTGSLNMMTVSVTVCVCVLLNVGSLIFRL